MERASSGNAFINKQIYMLGKIPVVMNTTMKYNLLLVICIIHTSCNILHISSTQPKQASSYCAPLNPYKYDPAFTPVQNSDSLFKKDTVLNNLFSEHDLLMTNATGTFKLIRELVVLGEDSSVDAKLESMQLELQIQQRLLLIKTEIDAISAELDCEGEKAGQLANYLDNLNNKRNTRLVVGSIIVGSITTIAAVIFNKNKTIQNTIAIGGSILSAGLGALAINQSGRKVKFEENRNVLEDIWFGPRTTKVYSPFVWYILNEKKFSNSQTLPLRETIKERWLKFELNDKLDQDTETLLFRHGGIYTAENLFIRENMLDQLQSTIRSIDQDMESFIARLNTILKLNK